MARLMSFSTQRNQARNLHQLFSETRWRSRLFANELDFITTRLAVQGVEHFDSYMMNLAEELEAIRAKYFGNRVLTEMTYVPRKQDEKAKNVRAKRADLLIQIMSENTGSPATYGKERFNL